MGQHFILHDVSSKTTSQEIDQQRIYIKTDPSKELNGVLLSILRTKIREKTSLTDYFEKNKKYFNRKTRS